MHNKPSFARNSVFAVVAFLLLSTSTISHATTDQRYYDIEIVLFQNSVALRDLPELVASPQPLQYPEQFIQLGMPVTLDTADYIPEYYFRLLPESEFRLNDAADKIASSNSYRILKHFAWRQPGLDKKYAVPIVIHESIAAEIPPAAAENETPKPLLYTQARLDGIITVSLSRYLHLETELRFEANGLAPLDDATTNSPVDTSLPTIKPRPTSAVYIEKQKRRMRSKELHYIDHPVIGMLVLMTPVEIPPQTETTPKALR